MSKSLRRTISIALTLCALVIPTVKVLAQPVKGHSYAWSGEVMMYDEKGKTVTVRAPYLEHINVVVLDALHTRTLRSQLVRDAAKRFTQQ